ncbi:hypothetical protein BMS3Abin15_00403 [bacterium BMS3Abin15]|nr:hypothetical protein BMS3Abin15_00403 [bacterium BMS3Abin15]HDZ85910.1 hypothetical protein [Candidatus Moranbacteria bacterium]
MNKRLPSELALGIIVILAIVIGWLILLNNDKYNRDKAPLPDSRPKECTMEAKICPDGSAVGRTGPNCEFSECPGEEKTLERPLIGSDEWENLPTEEKIRDMKEASGPGYEFMFTYHPDKLIISGKYVKTISLGKDDFPFYGFGRINFITSDSDRDKLPANAKDNFSFISQEQADEAFKTSLYSFDENKYESCDVVGKATIRISSYFIDNLESSGAVDVAKLEEVILKENPEVVCY